MAASELDEAAAPAMSAARDRSTAAAWREFFDTLRTP